MTNPVGFKVTDSAAGWNATDFDGLFVRKDCFTTLGLWVWGGNCAGQLGRNNFSTTSSPVQTVISKNSWSCVAAGDCRTTAIAKDGTLWSVGKPSLGNNLNVVSTSSPVQTVSGGNEWKSVATGRFVVIQGATAAIKTDGSLWLWGNGTTLGNNSVINVSSPVQTISGGTNWKSVSIGRLSVVATKTDGTLWLWGANSLGQLGTNTIINASSPVQTVSGGTNWCAISSGYDSTAAIKTDGTLWLWGCNVDGSLGDSSIINRSSPVQTVSGGTNWRSVDISFEHSAAIKTDGTLWLWGNQGCGKLGNNLSSTITNKSSPVQTVSGGTNWRSLSLGTNHSAAIKTDGTLWLWGLNCEGMLGNNQAGAFCAHSSPIQTISGGTDWRQVSLGRTHSTALRADQW
jgi:alpha-tubulin suppressor-like RCC1 family protein